MNGNVETEHQVYLGIGSNIQPLENLPRCLALLRQKVLVEEVSRIWKNPPVGSTGEDFLNAAVRIRTSLEAEDLKTRVLRPIESQLGRVRTRDKYAPRTIDLDILIIDGKVCDPQIWKRAFLAVPLAELLPRYTDPKTGETLSEAARRLAEKIPMEVCPEPQLDCFVD